MQSSPIELTNSSHVVTQLEDIRLIPFAEACRVLGIKIQLAFDWRWKKKFPVTVIKINGCLFVQNKELIDFVNSQLSSQKVVNSQKKSSTSCSTKEAE